MKKRKNTPSGSGRASVNMEYDYLQWLNVYIGHRDTTTNMCPPILSSTLSAGGENESLETGQENPLESNNFEVGDFLSDNMSPIASDTDVCSSNQGSSSGGTNHPSTKKTKKDLKQPISSDDSVLKVTIMDTMKQINNVISKNGEEMEDDITLFCKSIIPIIKRLTSQMQALAKLNIQQYLIGLEFPDIVNQGGNV